MMMLDASKAFDRVDHNKLFKILSKKGVCPTLLKLLLTMYSQQTMSVGWDKVISQSFVSYFIYFTFRCNYGYVKIIRIWLLCW